MKSAALLVTLATSVLAVPTTSSAGSSTCPANTAQPQGKLAADSISTSLLVPISARAPNAAFPASRYATITPKDLCTIFNLQLPAAATQNKVCNLVFDFPSQAQAPAPWVFSGPGTMNFTGYAFGAGAVAGSTTFNKQPPPGPSPPNPPPKLQPGTSYVVNSAPCGIPPNAGTVTVSGSLCSPDTVFVYQQGSGQCPMGFYVVLTDVK